MAAPTQQDFNALTVALELLRRAVDDSAAFTLVNLDERRQLAKAPPRPDFPPPEKSRGDAIATGLLARFGAILAPLSLLHTVLSQTNSGFGTFRKSLDLLGASLAPLVLPVFVLLATGMTLLSEVIFNKLLPKLDDWYTWFAKHGLPEVEKTADRAADAIDTGSDLWRLFNDGELPKVESLPRITETLARTAGPIPGLTGLLIDQFKPDGYDARRRAMEKGPAGPGGQPANEPTTGQRARAALADVLKSLQLSMGPKPAAYQLADVERQRTLAAAGADPLDARAMRMAITTVQKLLEVIAKNTDQKDSPTPHYPQER